MGLGEGFPICPGMLPDDCGVGLQWNRGHRSSCDDWGASEFSAVDGERCEFKFWKRYGQHCDDTVGDAGFDRDGTVDD